MVKLLYARVESACVTPWPALPDWKIRELLRQRDKTQRCLSLMSYTMLGASLGMDLTTLMRSDYGKPYLPTGPEFSLAHTTGMVVCALADGPVGVDVERLDALSSSNDVRMWTEQESYIKYLGLCTAKPSLNFSLWTGELPGGFLAAVYTGEGNEGINIEEWKCRQ